MQKIDATFKTEGMGEDTVAIFYISNKDEKIKGEDLVEWFKKEGYGCPSYKMTSDKQIELRIKCDPIKLDEPVKKPGEAEQLEQAKLVDALRILKKNEVKLNEESTIALLTAFAEYKRFYISLKLNTGYDGDYISSYCALFGKLVKEINIITQEILSRETIEPKLAALLSDFERIDTQVENIVYRTIVFPDLSPTATDLQSQKTALDLKSVILPKDANVFLKLLNMDGKIIIDNLNTGKDKIQLDTKNISNEAKLALRNISMYGTRLLIDFNNASRNKAGSKELREMALKLGGIIRFLCTVLKQKNINDEESKKEIQAGYEFAIESLVGEVTVDFMRVLYPENKQDQPKAKPVEKQADSQPEATIPMTVAKEGPATDLVIILNIDNSNDKIKIEELELWLKSEQYVCPHYEVNDNKQIQLRIKCNREQANQPKQPALVHVLNILSEKHIKLTADSNIKLGEWMCDAVLNMFISQVNEGIDIERTSTLVTLDGLSENYFNNLPTNIVNEVKKGGLAAGLAMQAANENWAVFFPSSNSLTFKPYWTALGIKPEITLQDGGDFASQFIIDMAIAMTYDKPKGRRQFNQEDFNKLTGLVSSNISQLTDEAKNAYRNILLYGSKLLVDLNDALRNKADLKKIKELEAKIKGINQFLNTALKQNGLNSHESKLAIQKGFETFEAKDVNRGEGFYSLYTRFNGKTYTDENGEERAIKSTSGELLHEFMKALFSPYSLHENLEDLAKLFPSMAQATTDLKIVGSNLVILPKDADNFLNQLEIKGKINLDTTKLPNEAKVALTNISAYGAKLLIELNESLRKNIDSKKIGEIEEKIENVNQFLSTVLSQKDINDAETKKVIQAAFETFERNDKNRGTGLYHVFAKGKKYTDKDGNEVTVKSTTGELVYDFVQALYPQDQQAKADTANKPAESLLPVSSAIPVKTAKKGLDENIVVTFTIENPDDKIKVEDLEKWFKDEKLVCPAYVVRDTKQIELKIKSDVQVPNAAPEQANQPKPAGLAQVLAVLDKHGINLSAESNRTLANLSKQERQDLGVSLFKTRFIGSDEKCVDKLFPSFKSTTFKAQWTAFGEKPEMTLTDEGNFAKQLKAELSNEKLDTSRLSDEVKNAFNNISVYGTKLLVDLDNALRNKADPKKIKELEAKIKGINQFLVTVLSQEDLGATDSRAAIEKAYITFEANDKNRGTGFYRFFMGYNGKKFTDDKGVERTIQSTSGELLHDFMGALYPAAVLQKKEGEKEEAKPTSMVL